MIEHLCLIGNKRLGLSLIEEISITFTEATQIILGRNGSGKSTLMGELTPLPGDHNDYHKGGSKLIRISHKGATYELSSTFNRGTGHHSFLVVETGEELNKGGTLAIQKELVFHHFNINRDRMNILLGKTRFTNMSPQQRQDWLTLLSPVSLDYAFSVFGTLKGLKRDQDGVVKYQQQRLGKESRDIPTEAEKKQLEKRLDSVTQHAESLMMERMRVQPNVDSEEARRHFERLQSRLHRVTQESKALLKRYPVHPDNHQVISDEETCRNELKKIDDQCVRSQTIIETLSSEYHTLQQQQPSKDENLSEEMVESLRGKIATHYNSVSELDKRIKSIMSELPIPLDDIGGRQDMEALIRQFEDELFSLIMEFPDNSDAHLSRSRGEKAAAVLQQAKSQQTNIEHRRDYLLARLQQLKTCEKVACPKCDHAFQPGVDPDETQRIDVELEQLATTLEKTKTTIKNAREYCEQIESYRHLLNRYQQLTQQYPYFPNLWTYLSENKVMTRHPKDHVTTLSDWILAMTLLATYTTELDRLDVLKNKLRYIDEIDQGTIDRVNERLKHIEKTIEKETHNVKFYTHQKKQMENYYKTVTMISTKGQQLVSEYRDILTSFDTLKNKYYLNAINKETKDVQLTMAQLKHELSDIELRVGIIDDLNRQLERCLVTQEDYKLLVKAMNPKDGLIGRYLKGFMENVVSFINAIISRIWTYDLEVLPSKVDKGKFDYRFPLVVEKGRTNAPDISEGSGSQVDIVDFAFRLLVMKFLKLEDFPLYFDEFGITFDEEHRTNLNLLITNMVEVGQTPQVFYISHYLQEHSSLTNAEVCVIDPNNITVPKAYNQHVTIR